MLTLIKDKRWTAFLIALVSVWVSSCNQSNKDKELNFLLIMSDNQSWNHSGAYGDQIVKTPHFDSISEQGIRFTQAFCAAPSCTPARAALLTGQDIWRLEEGANLWGTLPAKFKVMPDLLERAGYEVGYSGKGWGPGAVDASNRHRNPGGNNYDNFKEFLAGLVSSKKKKPWFFWHSSREPHRPFDRGLEKGIPVPIDKIIVPPYLPDTRDVRQDIADYYGSIQRFDDEIGRIIADLKQSGDFDNTVIIICSDNGWQMPRGLANLYDSGTRVPLIFFNEKLLAKGTTQNAIINLNDVTPTILELAGLKTPSEMTAKSLVPLIQRIDGAKKSNSVENKDEVFMGRERHAYVREGGQGYPARAIRTSHYLYIKNYEPDRWPAGDPPLFGDVDAHMMHYTSLSKAFMMQNKNHVSVKHLFDLAFAKRPGEELYDLHKDPYQLHNLGEDITYGDIKNSMNKRLIEYLVETGDPRETNGHIKWDEYYYYKEADKNPIPSPEYIKMLDLDLNYSY